MQEYPDEAEERLVNEEYKIWKKNTPFLYGALSCGTSASSPDLVATSMKLRNPPLHP